jgi:23S rRNA pseudouridine2605 synthase
VRIQKLLARAGVASRRAAESLMVQGRVRVNGVAVTTLGARIDPDRDVVEVDGKRVRVDAPRWIALHKPAGLLTTRSDPHGGRTVYALLPEEHAALRYVGRLDRETEGLLLLSNDGDLLNRLLHPSSELEREYHAGVHGFPSSDTLSALTLGVELDDGPARALRARRLDDERDGGVLALVLAEGRKREVRRLLEAVGHRVRWLRRVRFGPIRLGELPPGRWRELDAAEVESLHAAVER